jgi:GNAT superfamily N-acetyltransferase
MDTTRKPTGIRRMQASDVQAVAGLCGQLGYPATAEQIAARWSLLASDSGNAVFVAVSGDRIVGWLHVAHRPLIEYDACAEICGLVVDDRERGAGVGGALVAAAEEWAIGAGLMTIRVRSRVERDRAHTFYERHGYTRLKTQYVFEKPLG